MILCLFLCAEGVDGVFAGSGLCPGGVCAAGEETQDGWTGS